MEPLAETAEGWSSISKNLRPDVGAVIMDCYFNLTYTHTQRCIEYIKVNKALFLVGAGDEKGAIFNTVMMG